MGRKRIKQGIASGLLLLAGVLVLVFPYISRRIYQFQVDQIVKEYDERMEAAREKNDNFDKLYRSIADYNVELYQHKQSGMIGTVSFEQVDFDLRKFGYDEDIFGYITIPKMEITLPIYLGATQVNLKKGAAHLSQTSLPIGGINTNAVIAAHRDMGTKVMFHNIEWLEYGDKVYITNFREKLTYKVVETVAISPTDIEKILIQEGRDLITLMTCHPMGDTSQRYLVYCERVVVVE